MKGQRSAYMYTSTKCAWIMSSHLKLDILKKTPFIKQCYAKPYNGDFKILALLNTEPGKMKWPKSPRKITLHAPVYVEVKRFSRLHNNLSKVRAGTLNPGVEGWAK